MKQTVMLLCLKGKQIKELCMEPILFFIVLFGFIIGMRYIQYRERMDMLNRGLTPKDYRPINPTPGGPPATDYVTGTLLPPQYQQPGPYQPRPGLRSRYSPAAMQQRSNAIITLLVGVGMTFGLGTIGWGPWLMPGFIVTFVGLALLINYYVTTDVVALPQPSAQPPASKQQPMPPQQPGYNNVPPAQTWDAKQWGAPLSDQVPPPPAPYLGEQGKREGQRLKIMD
jgi:hypothetical protein